MDANLLLDVPTILYVAMIPILVPPIIAIKILVVGMNLMCALKKILVRLYIVVNTKAASLRKSTVMMVMLALKTLVILLDQKIILVNTHTLIVMMVMLALLILAAQKLVVYTQILKHFTVLRKICVILLLVILIKDVYKLTFLNNANMVINATKILAILKLDVKASL
jgi:hypothetical protein